MKEEAKKTHIHKHADTHQYSWMKLLKYVLNAYMTRTQSNISTVKMKHTAKDHENGNADIHVLVFSMFRVMNVYYT